MTEHLQTKNRFQVQLSKHFTVLGYKRLVFHLRAFFGQRAV